MIDNIDNLIKASYDGIIIFDAYGNIVHAGGELLDKFDEQCWLTCKEISLKAIKKGKTSHHLLQDEQEHYSFLLTANPIISTDMKKSYVFCNVRDLHDLNSVERNAFYQSATDHDSQDYTPISDINADLQGFITRSVTMQSVLATALRVASVDSTILILGESGVGKSMLAKFIHKNSKRKDFPFVRISCGAIPEQLLESELFGYEGGAFSGAAKNGKPGLFELAENGTVFLDEIGEIPLFLQVKLLTVLQERKFMRIGGLKELSTNARIIAATNKDLKEQVKKGEFRADLYYRLNVVPLLIPPLRERRGDILPLVNHFLQTFNKKYGYNRKISPEVLNYLVKYDWPGNIRELENIIEYLVVVVPDDVIQLKHLPEHLITSKGHESTPHNTHKTLKDALNEYERDLLTFALREHSTLKEAANSLGIDISTLIRKKQKYGL